MKRYPQAFGEGELPLQARVEGVSLPATKQCKLTAWNVGCIALVVMAVSVVLGGLHFSTVDVVLATKQMPAGSTAPVRDVRAGGNQSDAAIAQALTKQQRREQRQQRAKTANGWPDAAFESQTHLTVLPFKPVRHTAALTRECDTCALPFRAPVHIVNKNVTRKVVLGDFACNMVHRGQHHVMMLLCLCPSTGLLAQLIHLARTHEIHVHRQRHFDQWWTFFDAAFRRAKVPYTLIRNTSSFATVANESSYSDVFRVLPILYQSRSMCKNCLRDLVYQHNNLAFDAPCSSVLYISRQNEDRMILDEDVLMPELTRVASKFDLPLTVYTGNESIPEMTTLFAGKKQAFHCFVEAFLTCIVSCVCVQVRVPWWGTMVLGRPTRCFVETTRLWLRLPLLKSQVIELQSGVPINNPRYKVWIIPSCGVHILLDTNTYVPFQTLPCTMGRRKGHGKNGMRT
jgi:hypothetical protein